MLPVVDVTKPAALAGQPNGMLPDSLLTAVDQYGGRLQPTALRALRAMLAALEPQCGVQMTYTSAYDCYRPYSIQLITFTARYKPVSSAVFNTYDAVDRKSWPTNPDGQRYWVKRSSNVATAAVPGTSNHGYGLAVDLARGTAPSNAVYIGNEGTAVTEWLKAHAATYGYSGETQSEPWHWRYWAGDAIPAAVLAYEKPNPPHPHPLEDDDVAPAVYTWKERVSRFTIDFEKMTVCFLSDAQADAGVTAGDLRYALPDVPFVVSQADFLYFINDTPGNTARGQSIKQTYGL